MNLEDIYIHIIIKFGAYDKMEHLFQHIIIIIIITYNYVIPLLAFLNFSIYINLEHIYIHIIIKFGAYDKMKNLFQHIIIIISITLCNNYIYYNNYNI